MYQSRKARGKTQKIFLLECHQAENNYARKYDVMGTTRNVYTVNIKNIPECTCPDYQTRHRRCKHIYFILIRIMKVSKDEEDSDYYDNKELQTMFNNIPDITANLTAGNKYTEKYKKFKGTGDKKSITVKQGSLDDICAVCLDDLENGDELDYCRFSCGKNVHKLCHSMWTKKQPKAICLFCRAPWNVTTADYEYINLE